MGTKNRRLIGLIVVALLFLSSYASAIKIASWNLLQYPGTTGISRHPDYKTVIKALNPDILVVQEMGSIAGVNQFLANVMNSSYPTKYAAGPFFNGPDSDNAIFYNKSILSILSHRQIVTALRDISEYVMKITSGPGAGTIFRVYSVHLKAGETTADKLQRTNEAAVLRNYLNSLSANSLFLLCGDLNLYSNAEQAFIKLTGSQTDNDGQVVDPTNRLGVWHDNASYANLHTQSTRKVQFGGGASGGMDDRFDFILISSALKTSTKLAYKTASYKAFGNDGRHFDLAVNVLPNTAVSTAIADSLYKASDHLPVTLELTPPTTTTLTAPSNLSAAKASSTAANLTWKDNSTDETGFKIERKTTSSWSQIATVGANVKSYQDTALSSTTYYYRVRAYKGSLYSAYSNSASVNLGGSGIIVYITETGTKYHRDGCRYLSHSKIAIYLSEAKAQGYTPCSVCNPPTFTIPKAYNHTYDYHSMKAP